jgi:LysR family nitrogen assimilation transcriptional regulator
MSKETAGKIDLRQLRYFVSVVDMGSLSKATGALAITQPSLTQQIARMEYALGVPLLIRSAAGVRPTDAGSKLYHHARLVLRQMLELETDVVSESSGAVGQVAVGLPTSIAAPLGTALVERLSADHPGVRLQLFESYSGYLAELLANGRLDMAVLFREAETSGLRTRKLFTEQLSVFGAPEVGNPDSATCDLARLAGVPLMLPGRLNGLRLLVERTFAQAGLVLNVVADIDSLPVMLAMAQQGKVATINSAAVARVSSGRILSRRLINPTIERPVSLCQPISLPQTAAALAAEETIRTLVRERAVLWDISA